MIIPTLTIDPTFEPHIVRIALVWGMNIPNCPKTVSLPPYISALLEKVRSAGETFLPLERKRAVRAMLRFGSYKPSGRSKPSSEYLLGAALSNEFPLVNPPVDANNAVSLQWGYPASIFDLDLCGPVLLLRRGKAGESYVFNQSGQSINLEDLICICRADGEAWIPCGNPVKDAMVTKITHHTRNVVAVIYAPYVEPVEDLQSAAKRLAELLGSECAAQQTGWRLY